MFIAHRQVDALGLLLHAARKTASRPPQPDDADPAAILRDEEDGEGDFADHEKFVKAVIVVRGCCVTWRPLLVICIN